MIELLPKWFLLVVSKIKLSSKYDFLLYENKLMSLFLRRLKKALGSHAHICTENKELPKIIKSLFLSSMVKG